MKKEVRKNLYTYTMFGLLAYFVSQIVGGQNVVFSMPAATLLPKALERLCKAIQTEDDKKRFIDYVNENNFKFIHDHMRKQMP